MSFLISTALKQKLFGCSSVMAWLQKHKPFLGLTLNMAVFLKRSFLLLKVRWSTACPTVRTSSMTGARMTPRNEELSLVTTTASFQSPNALLTVMWNLQLQSPREHLDFTLGSVTINVFQWLLIWPISLLYRKKVVKSKTSMKPAEVKSTCEYWHERFTCWKDWHEV